MLWVGFAVTGPGYLWAICPTVKPVEKNQGVAMIQSEFRPRPY